MTQEEFKNIAPKLYELQQLGNSFTIPKDYFGTVEDAVFSKLSTDKLNSKSAFRTPENYFSTIEGRIFDKIKSEKKENAYAIPKGYFDTIEDNVFKKLHTETKIINFRTRFIKTFLPIAAAASLLLFITLQILNNTKEQDLFASLETSEIENWIENNDLVLNSYEIASIYEDIDIEDIEINTLYSDDEMLNYLNEVESFILTN